MTVRTSTFAWQLGYLKEHGHPVIPLRSFVSYLLGEASAPPAGAVNLTVDDGHRSVYTDMLPVMRQYGFPVTLFVYPSAISNASYAMSWEQLGALHRTGLFDLQSHTYWHPNFTIEKRRLAAAAYRAFVTMQLTRPRSVLKERIGIEPNLIAWPFGLYDEELLDVARTCGYVAGLTLDRRLAGSGDQILALPRFLVTDAAFGKSFTTMLPSGTK
jgi:peptidoglycan/xylan/chitin deacetylase (PgdA/CDA1 family)